MHLYYYFHQNNLTKANEIFDDCMVCIVWLSPIANVYVHENFEVERRELPFSFGNDRPSGRAFFVELRSLRIFLFYFFV